MLSLSFALLVSALAADSWPQFRGPHGSGVAAEDPKLPDKWSATENVVWKIDVPGVGWSSPVIWGDRIYVTSVIDTGNSETPKKGLYGGEKPNGDRPIAPDPHRWMVYAIDFKSGKILWQREAHKGVPESPHHPKNSYASETPVTDGDRVYAYFGNVGIFAYDRDGNLVWSVRMPPHMMQYGWGTGASPILHQGRLYIANDNDDASVLLCLDAKTGKTIWKVERDEASNWATPLLWENEKRTELIVAGRRKVRSYDLDGKLLWELSGMSRMSIPSPIGSFELAYVSSGFLGDEVRPVWAIKAGASGDITLKSGETSSNSIAWYQRQAGSYNTSPIIYGDYYYTLLDRGFITCHDARTGKLVYDKQRIDGQTSGFTASPWAYNGKVFLLSEDGDTYVVESGPEYKLLRKNSLDEMVLATPAISQGSLFIRTASKLYRIGK